MGYNIFQEMGFDIITKNEYDNIICNENNELNELYNKEKFEIDNIRDYIDYDLNEIEEIQKDGDKIIDIQYKKTDKSISYLEWYLSNNYIDGMNWYIKKFSHIPFIEDMSYFLVKKDLTGKVKLDKWEKVIIKKEIQKRKRAQEILESERQKSIRKLQREKNKPQKFLKYENKKVIVNF